eukprot:TRINITY_DN3957_c0_g1_i1.p1 TRINITY_DN3957_c0_g1~~TRINITY_DN3957_c0_g1_i1.p1  ORF type:complete len:425 (-),score=102.44 TRINITY_DN3957_c0_g1_i1:585-1859(-)
MSTAAMRQKQKSRGASSSQQQSSQSAPRKSASLSQSQSSQIADSQDLHSGKKQGASERRDIRKGYRKLIAETTEKREEYIQPDSNGLDRQLEKSNAYYDRVRQPREAALDAEMLKITTEFGVEQVHRLHAGFKTRDMSEFISKIKGKLRPQTIEGQYEETENQRDAFDWESFGKFASKFVRSTPTISFLLGPLAAVPKERKERVVKHREKDTIEKQINPDEIKNTTDDGTEHLDSETSRNVQEVKSHLEKAKEMNFYKFIFDPKSFSNTVENMFHLSFLIKEGHASLKLDESRQPIVGIATPANEMEESSGDAVKRQTVVQLNYSDWEEWKRKFNVTDGFLPHREPRKFVQKISTSASSESQRGHSKKDSSKNKKQTKRKGEEISDNEETSTQLTKPAKKRSRASYQSSSEEDEELELTKRPKK